MSRKKQKPQPERIEVSVEEISAIVERTQTGALSAEDHAKLKAAIDTFALVTAQLQTKDASIERLRHMIFGATTESTRNVLGEKHSEPPAAGSTKEPAVPRPKPPGHGRNAAAAYTGANQVMVVHPDLHGGETCPGCTSGKLYLQSEPAKLVRITGMAPLSATVYACGRLRCNLCGEVFTAPATVADDLVAQPFIDARKPGTWQSVMTRAACADRFALAVVASVAEDKRQAVLGLNDLALKHTFMILSTKHIPTQSLQTFFWLTLQAVHGMRFLTKPDELRETWALAEVLPDFVRAIALWSSPDLVSKHKILACELFRRVGCLPLSRAARDLQMSQMLCLLDFSVSSCATTGDAALIARIISLWGDAYEDWLPITDQWSSAAEMLVGAITSEGQDRARLFADPTFASSYCRQIIEAQKP